MQILVVDDEPAVRDSLDRALRLEGYKVELAADGTEALDSLGKQTVDAIVLDLMMPRVGGLEVCRRLRSTGDRTPVLILTARDAVADRVAGLDAGADDYVVKPFDLNELSARLRALLRRGAGRATPVLAHGEVELSPATREVRLRGQPLALSAREFALLEALLARPGAILSRAQLEDKLYGWSDPVESNAVEVHIHALRKKLGADFIRNVRGVGWMVARAPASA